MTSTRLRMIPIGGVGDFGANATIFQSEHKTILVDFGLMFPPDGRQPGVDYYVTDAAALFEHFPDLDALFVTHGHEDHIGGIPYLLKQRNIPVFTMPYTAQLIGNKCKGHTRAKIKRVSLNQPVEWGDLRVEFIGVTHSIAQACALSIRSDTHHIIHSGDFKVDGLPGDGYPFQWQRLRELGDQGVDLLIMDSTNAHKTGFSPGETRILGDLEAAIGEARGRVFFTTFSSHMPRLRRLRGIAQRLGRRICLLGRSFHRHHSAALDTGYLAAAPDLMVSREDADSLPAGDVIYVVTGSQGERASVLSRLANGRYQDMTLTAGDTVILSSKTIPGNERTVALMVSDMKHRGIQVKTSNDAHIHVSGHGYREDNAFLYALTRPRHVIPIHGEHSFLLNHESWLRQLAGPNQNVHLIENGDVVELQGPELNVLDKIEIDLVPFDGNQDAPIDWRQVKDRKDMMYSGLILISANRGRSGRLDVEIATHGLVDPSHGDLADALQAHLGLTVDAGRPKDTIASTIKRETRRFLKRRFSGRPFIKIVLDGSIMA